MSDQTQVPQHIAMIMDGNRRWARQHGLQIIQGHEKVAEEVIESLALRCVERGVQYLTLWAFSTENWQRDQREVTGLMELFRRAFSRNAEKLHKHGIRLNYIGDLTKFPEDIQHNVAEWLEISKNNDQLTVTFALNYGGRDEITRAVQAVAQQVAAGKITPTDITAEMIGQQLDTATMPDPDLLIRPGGEQRLSGYLPWQSVYAELYFTPILMPDFGPDQLDEAIAEFQHRSRRFGK